MNDRLNRTVILLWAKYSSNEIAVYGNKIIMAMVRTFVKASEPELQLKSL